MFGLHAATTTKRFFLAESLNLKSAILILLNKISLALGTVWKQVKKRVKYGKLFPIKRNCEKSKFSDLLGGILFSFIAAQTNATFPFLLTSPSASSKKKKSY